MMDLRSQPGTVVDNVFYRNQSIVIRRKGKARAVIVPLREYADMQRRKQEAKERFFAMTDEIRKRTAQDDPEAIQAAIDEAVEAVRREKKSP
jgi:antitoxin (DNA-binding transcriptional repressor) of toxin-antitoxin stability system